MGFSSFVLCKTTTLTSVQRNKDESRICCISMHFDSPQLAGADISMPSCCAEVWSIRQFESHSWKQFYGEPCDSVPGQLLMRGLAADTWQPSASLR